MRKIHQNLFYYYSGQHKEDQQLDKQIENNTTKAFINVLENSSLSIQKRILEKILGIKITESISKINYTLQESSIGRERIKSIPKKFVLAVSKSGKIYNSISKKYTNSSIPDAWIWCDKFVVLVENKVGLELEKYQINQHKKILNNKCIVLNKNWKNIYYILKDISKSRNLIEKDNFLLKEFIYYLEVIQMTSFEGFDKQDRFRIFSDDREERSYVRKKLVKLMEEMYPKLKNHGLHHHQQIKEWIIFCRKLSNSVYYNVAHFGFYPPDLKLYLMLRRGKDLTNFIKKVKSNSKGLFMLLNQLKNSSFEIKLVERIHTRDMNPYETDKKFELILNSDYFKKEDFEVLVKELIERRFNNIWLQIYVDYDWDSDLDLYSNKKFASELTQDIKELLPIYKYMIT